MKFFSWLRELKEKIVKDPLPVNAVAGGWALGMFVGCFVPFGLQLLVSVPIAIKFRLSKIGATVGTLLTNPVTIWFIYPAQTWVALHLLGNGRSWEALEASCNRLGEVSPFKFETWRILGEVGGTLLGGFFLGGLLLALVMTPITYWVVRFIVIKYRSSHNRQRIGIYGGSFNPVHYGHVNIAKKAIADLRLDRLIVIPANVSPFKTEGDRTIAALDRSREIEHLKAAFSAVEKSVVDERELQRGGVSYSIDTVREIAAENPGAELFFLIGEDSVEGLPRWKDVDKLRRLCTFKSFPRTKESSTEIRNLFAAGKVRLNPDEKIASVVWQGVLRKKGYCPCRLASTPETFCPCEEFRQQLADPKFSGLCHCRLYEKGGGEKQ